MTKSREEVLKHEEKAPKIGKEESFDWWKGKFFCPPRAKNVKTLNKKISSAGHVFSQLSKFSTYCTDKEKQRAVLYNIKNTIQK